MGCAAVGGPLRWPMAAIVQTELPFFDHLFRERAANSFRCLCVRLCLSAALYSSIDANSGLTEAPRASNPLGAPLPWHLASVRPSRFSQASGLDVCLKSQRVLETKK